MADPVQNATKSLHQVGKHAGRWVARRWVLWLYGLMSAAIGSGANAVSVMIIDPASFNFHQWRRLISFIILSAAISAALYLKQAPLPPLTDEEVRAAVKRRTAPKRKAKPPATP